MHMVRFAQYLFASASASLAIFSLSYGDFAPGGQSWPVWIPGREAWVYGFAILVLTASIGVFFARTALGSVLMIGIYLATWVALGLPGGLSQPLSIGGWYGFCEALSALVGGWLLFTMLRSQQDESQLPMGGEHARRVAQILFGLTCVFYGSSHFTYADYTATMVPRWLPAPLDIAYITGLAHIVAGICIIVRILPRLAATLEAVMMTLFGLLVWVPSFFAQPRPQWATPPQNQWSELVVNLVLAASAWIVATSFRECRWFAAAPLRAFARPRTADAAPSCNIIK